LATINPAKERAILKVISTTGNQLATAASPVKPNPKAANQ